MIRPPIAFWGEIKYNDAHPMITWYFPLVCNVQHLEQYWVHSRCLIKLVNQLSPLLSPPAFGQFGAEDSRVGTGPPGCTHRHTVSSTTRSTCASAECVTRQAGAPQRATGLCYPVEWPQLTLATFQSLTASKKERWEALESL